MRHRFKCNTCGGEYFDTCADGSLYHHACPPLPPTKQGNEPERENKRDENIAVRANRRAAGIKAEGDGVTCLTSKSLEEPAWITKLKERIVREEEQSNA